MPIRLVLGALAAVALVVSGVILAVWLPHSTSAPPHTSFLGPTATDPQH